MGSKLPASLQDWSKNSIRSRVGGVFVSLEILYFIHRGHFIVVINRDFICCPHGPSFLICKTKGLDIILNVFFSIILWVYLYTKNDTKVCLSSPASSLDLSPQPSSPGQFRGTPAQHWLCSPIAKVKGGRTRALFLKVYQAWKEQETTQAANKTSIDHEMAGIPSPAGAQNCSS